MRMRILLCVTAVFFISVQVGAQNFMNILNFRYYYLPTTTLKSNNKEISYREYRVETALPYKCKNGNVFGIKPLFKTFTLSGNDSLKNLHLYSIKLSLFTVIKFKNPKWSSYFEICPKINSDFKNIGWNHFQLGGTLLMYYEKKKNFFWQFGVYYNQEAFGPYPMILLGLDWRIDPNNYIGVLLPAFITYERKLNSKFYTGFEMELSGESYRLGGSLFNNSYISQFGENKFSFVIEPRLFLDYYISKHIVIYLKPGIRLFLKDEQYDDKDNRLINSDYVQGQIKNCFYMEAGIAFRFRYDEPTLPSDNTSK
jgi:Domain of unknown function (DUF6268)